MTLVSSAEETAKDVYRVLQQTGLDRDPTSCRRRVHRFTATGDPEPFARLGRRFLGPEIGTVTTWRRRMRLTVLGCSGTYPGPDSPCSGYLLEHDGFRLVVDLGPGALGPLQRSIDLLEIDAVYVSHLHADHCTDLVGLSYARRYHPDGLAPPLPVCGPAGLADRLCQVFEVPPPDRLAPVYDFHEVPVGAQVDRAVHDHDPAHGPPGRVPRPARRGRRAHPRLLAATPGRRRALTRLAEDADAFLCEASWPDAPDRPPRPAPVGPAGGRARGAGPRPPAAAHPPHAVDRPRGDGRRGACGVRRPGRGGPLRRDLRRLTRAHGTGAAPSRTDV